jgi:hypothetical protein
MLRHLNSFLSEQSAGWGLPSSTGWNFWLYNNSHPHITNLDVMWFHGDDRFPRVVTKLDRNPDTLAREFENLSSVYSRIPDLVPRPLHFGRWEQYWALWLEGIPGSPFGCSTSNLDTIVQTLLSFHSAVRSGNCRPERYRRMAQDPLENAARSASSAVRSGCDRLLRSIDAKWLDSLPVIPQHGDFFPDNVSLFQGQSRVLDWETFGAIDLPLYDLVTFLASLVVPTESALSTLDVKTARDVQAAVERYAKGIGLTHADIELLLPLSLVNWRLLMQLDGRTKFVARMDGLIEHYFEHPEIWHRVFLPGFGFY